MTDTAIILDEIDGRKAAAFVIAGQLEDFFLTSPDSFGLVPGTICRGVIDQFVKILAVKPVSNIFDSVLI